MTTVSSAARAATARLTETIERGFADEKPRSSPSPASASALSSLRRIAPERTKVGGFRLFACAEKKVACAQLRFSDEKAIS